MKNVPPNADGNPPFVDGKHAALKMLAFMRDEIGRIEAWVQTVADDPARPATPPRSSRPKKTAKKPPRH